MSDYALTPVLAARAYRHLLDVVQRELDRNDVGLTAVQAALLHGLGPQTTITAGELRTRGFYLGQNASYTIKKLVRMGMINRRKSRADAREAHVSLTDKGLQIFELVDQLYRKHAAIIGAVGDLNAAELETLNKLLHRLDRFWEGQVLYQQ